MKFQIVASCQWTLTKPSLVQHLRCKKGYIKYIPGTTSFWLISVWTLTARELSVMKRKKEITVKTQLYNDSAEMTAQIKTAAKTFLRRLYNFLVPLLPC